MAVFTCQPLHRIFRWAKISGKIQNRGRDAFSLDEENETEDDSVGIIETVSQDEIDLRTRRYNRLAGKDA